MVCDCLASESRALNQWRLGGRGARLWCRQDSREIARLQVHLSTFPSRQTPDIGVPIAFGRGGMPVAVKSGGASQGGLADRRVFVRAKGGQCGGCTR
jgi:hypothetical protein